MMNINTLYFSNVIRCNDNDMEIESMIREEDVR